MAIKVSFQKSKNTGLRFSLCIFVIPFGFNLLQPLTSPNYIPILVPALGLLVPFVIRWIENKSRLQQAKHLMDVIKTRDEIEKLLSDTESRGLTLLENEEIQLLYYQRQLEKEIRRNDAINIRLYPILISLEMIFFISILFTGALKFLQNLIYAQGDATLPFLEGIFSDYTIRISLLIFCLLGSLYMTHSFQKRLIMKRGVSFKNELLIFLAFNVFFVSTLLFLGLVLYLLDLVMPWF